MDRMHFVLDAPTGQPRAMDGQSRSRLQVAKLGAFKDPRYGSFKITADQVRSWAQNLAQLPGGRAPIDLDHAADRAGSGRNTEAAGWITALSLQDGVPIADVEWTPLGEQAIREKRYLFFSPTYGPHVDEEGKSLGDTLVGGALTNRPFLAMPTVCLARMPSGEQDPDSEPGPVSDSPPPMPDFSNIAKALGLPEDADEAKTLEAIASLSAQADKPAEPAERKTLDQLASESGKVLLDASQVSDLTEKANAGQAAAAELRESKFSAAFTTALDKGCVDAKEETRDLYHKLYQADSDTTLQTLASLQPIVSTVPRGQTGDQADPPAGVDEGSWKLDRQVRELAVAENLDYLTALDRVTGSSLAEAGV